MQDSCSFIQGLMNVVIFIWFCDKKLIYRISCCWKK